MPENKIVETEEALQKKRKKANLKNNLRALGVVGIALLVLIAVVAVCELYQELCLGPWARVKG